MGVMQSYTQPYPLVDVEGGPAERGAVGEGSPRHDVAGLARGARRDVAARKSTRLKPAFHFIGSQALSHQTRWRFASSTISTACV